MMCAAALEVLAQPARAQVTAEKRAAQPPAEPDLKLYFSTGLSFATREGELGRTDYYRVPFTARVTKGPLRLSASIPYLVVSGTGVADGEGEDDGGEIVTDEGTRRGFGDLRLSARYQVAKSAPGGFGLDLLSQVKVPTASRKKGLGTGELDFALGAELSRDLGRFEPFVSAQFRINGDRPDQDYRNSIAASVGTAVQLSRRTRASISYDYSQSRIKGRPASQSLAGNLTTRLSKRFSLSGTGSVGLSERAPDFSVGSVITWRAF